MRSLATALESYYVDANHYPAGAANGLTINPRVLRYRPLTTPIAYITTPPKDIFNNDFNTEDDRYYIYQDRESYFKPIPGGNRYSAADATIRFLYDHFYLVEAPSAQWLLRSRGPSIGPIDTNAPPKFDINDIYDPTNGTISVGNILRVGPGGGGASYGE
jgi:hypothetical protein